MALKELMAKVTGSTKDLPIRTKRIRRLEITADALVAYFKWLDGTQTVRCQGMPKDATCVGVAMGNPREREGYNAIYLWIESKEFDPIPENEIVPSLEITLYYTEI